MRERASPGGLFRLAGLVTLAVLLLIAAGCLAEPRKTPPVRSGWSRGLLLGHSSLPEPPAFLVTDELVYAAWNEKTGEGSTLRLVALDRQANPVQDLLLALGLNFPHSPVLSSLQGKPTLFFLARPSGESLDTLYALHLTGDGRPAGRPEPVTPAEMDVESFAVALLEHGWFAVWEVKGEPYSALYCALLDEQAHILEDPFPLAEWGERPVAYTDADGVVHVAWMQREAQGRLRIFYTETAEPPPSPTGAVQIAKYVMGLGGAARSLALGLDASHVYLFWDVEYRGGPRQGSAETRVAVFPRGKPAESREFNLSLPESFPEFYPEGEFPFIPLPPEGARYYSSYVLSPWPAPGEGEILYLGISVKTWRRGKGYVQPAVVAMQEGEHRGFQVAAATKGLSLYPRLLFDSRRHGHLLWSDMRAYGQYAMYYASTVPETRAVLDRITPDDVGRIAADFVLGALGGLSLIPLLIVAAFPALILVSGYHVFGGEGDLSEPWPRVMLVVSLVAYLAFKLLLSSPFISTVPFSTWLPQKALGPATLALAGLVLALDALALALYWRRSARPVLLIAWAVFVLCDALLTAIFYGPALVGG